jgi:Tol biopolymer transport system component
VDKHLFRVDPITGARHALSHNSRWAYIEPAVAPDGRRIAFVRGQAENPQAHVTPVQLIASRHIFLMDADGTHPHQVTKTPGWTDEVPFWSPDGRWLLFVRWRRHSQGRDAQAALWAVRTNGTDTQRVARLDLPGGFQDGFGFFGAFDWRTLFDVAP